ncbi:putative polyhedral envelope protein, partial [Trichinella spiralis]|uniref:putative polyhedral envelope protein n=1 Tax=Trichinella spiralis TaxID=6334 RepID=UPI0001EFDE78
IGTHGEPHIPFVFSCSASCRPRSVSCRPRTISCRPRSAQRGAQSFKKKQQNEKYGVLSTIKSNLQWLRNAVNKLRERFTTLPLATAALETGFCALKPLTEDKL